MQLGERMRHVRTLTYNIFVNGVYCLVFGVCRVDWCWIGVVSFLFG